MYEDLESGEDLLCLKVTQMPQCSYFSTKTYAVGSQKY